MRKIVFTYAANEKYAGLMRYSASTLKRFDPDADVRVHVLNRDKAGALEWRMDIPLYDEFGDADVVVWMDADTEVVASGLADVIGALPDAGWWIAGSKDLARSAEKAYARFGPEVMAATAAIPFTRSNDYLNAGVMAFNLRAIAKPEWKRRRDIAMNVAKTNRLMFFDQDALHLMEVPQAILPPSVNAMTKDPSRLDGRIVVHYAGDPSGQREMAARAGSARILPASVHAVPNPTAVFSMTTHGKRLPLVGRVIPYLGADAAECGAAACLTVFRGDAPNLTDAIRETCARYGVEILVAGEDLGSSLKFSEAARRWPGLPVAVRDDDAIYPEGAFRQLLDVYAGHPESMVVRRGRKMAWKLARVPDTDILRTHRIKTGMDVREPTRETDFYGEGFAGMVIPAGALSNYGEVRRAALSCPANDDVAIRLLVIRAKKETWLCPCGELHERDFYDGVEREPVYRETSLFRRYNRFGGTARCIVAHAAELWAGRDT